MQRSRPFRYAHTGTFVSDNHDDSDIALTNGPMPTARVGTSGRAKEQRKKERKEGREAKCAPGGAKEVAW